MFGKKKKDTQVTSGDNNQDQSNKSFVGKMKDKAVEKMLEKQLGQLPPEQKAVVMKAVEENPEFFKKIADEIKQLEKGGTNQFAASMQVMRKYQGEMQKILMGK